MFDETFGDIEYDYGWVGTFSYHVLGQDAKIKLFVPCDDGDDIENTQRQAFERFGTSKERLSRLAEQAIFEYYVGIVDEYRERLGPEFRDRMAPVIFYPAQLSALVRPTEIVVQQTFGSQERIVGLLFDCTWEPSLGLAVKFVDETINEVGTQDIVL